MKDLTIDVQVLRIGSGKGDPKQYQEECRKLMEKMIAGNYYKVAIDRKGRIEEQYNRQLKHSYGLHWFTLMLQKGKYVPISAKLNKGIRVALETKGFSRRKDDFKYVEVASGTESKIIISYDPHYSKQIKKILKKIAVIIRRANSI